MIYRSDNCHADGQIKGGGREGQLCPEICKFQASPGAKKQNPTLAVDLRTFQFRPGCHFKRVRRLKRAARRLNVEKPDPMEKAMHNKQIASRGVSEVQAQNDEAVLWGRNCRLIKKKNRKGANNPNGRATGLRLSLRSHF